MTGFAALYQDTETGAHVETDALLAGIIARNALPESAARLVLNAFVSAGMLVAVEPVIEFAEPEIEIEFVGNIVPLRIPQPGLAVPYGEAA